MPNNPLFKLNGMIHPRALFLLAVLVALSIACNLPIMAQQEKPAGFVETSVAQTLAVLEADQPVQADDQSGTDDTAIATLTFTPEITDTPTLTPTVTNTPTPEVAMVYASANTNCRTGQGTEFTWLTTINQGTSAEAVGVDTSGEYWYIRRPDQPSSFCWLWGKYATPSGPYQSLPVYTPVPTPTLGLTFSVKYHSKETCGAQWGLVYEVVNIGGFTLESWQTSAVDHTGGSLPTDFSDDAFREYSGCVPVNVQQDLEPGEGQHVLMIFNANPTGHDITTTIKICTKNGLAGDCVSKKVRHTP